MKPARALPDEAGNTPMLCLGDSWFQEIFISSFSSRFYYSIPAQFPVFKAVAVNFSPVPFENGSETIRGNSLMITLLCVRFFTCSFHFFNIRINSSGSSLSCLEQVAALLKDQRYSSEILPGSSDLLPMVQAASIFDNIT